MIVVIAGNFDPPTHDLSNACDGIFKRAEAKTVWMCPLSTSTDKTHIRNMATLFCQSYYAARTKTISCCTVALDKGLDLQGLLQWARNKYPKESFRLMTFGQEQDKEPVYRVHFDQNPVSDIKDIPIHLSKAVCVGNGIRERIARGVDESRNVYGRIWDYIQYHKLYR